MVKFAMIHDLRDPNDPKKRTYKEINLAKRHKFQIGSLVEIGFDDDRDWEWSGVRLYVCKYTRDCDGTPLYSLGFDGCSDPYYMHSGFSENCLTAIKPPRPEQD